MSGGREQEVGRPLDDLVAGVSTVVDGDEVAGDRGAERQQAAGFEVDGVGPRWPEAGIVDAQTVKGADTVRADTRSYEAGKRTNGRKRHIVVDTLGLLVVVLVMTAALQDRDGGRLVLDRARMRMPSIALVWADGAYGGKVVAVARHYLHIALDIVKKRENQRGFEVLPCRWVVERILSWISRYRRLSKDYERLPAHAEAMVKWAMIVLMARRFAPAPGRRPWEPGTAQ